MHITKIELENIKSHIDSKYEFTRGTTAITGENGAGKTTLIEAVAWTLFDFLDYKKDEFLRRGAKKGIVRVTFESSLDEREYTVYRDTGTGYYVYDPRLKMRIAEKKEDVTRFLWQHLGVEPGTELSTLFKQAIGVPQGTFTAIFLTTATERKKTFDALLKVEEYRRGADELLKTHRFVENQIGGVREKIARAEGELANAENIETDHKNTAAQAADLEKNYAAADAEAAAKSEAVRKFEEIAEKTERTRLEFEKLRSEESRAEILLEQKNRELQAAVSAAEIIKASEADHAKYQLSVSRLHELERERTEREKLRTELSKVESAAVNVRSDQRRLQENFENILKAHQLLETLKPASLEQEELEKETITLRNKLANGKAAANQIRSLDEKIVRLREHYKANQTQLKLAETGSKDAADLDNLQKRDSDIVLNLAQLRASLERDQKFQSEIKNGLCPILSQKCLNLKEGETLESYITSQFSELRTQIADFESEQKNVSVSLRAAREAEKFAAALASLSSRAGEIADEGKRLSEERDALQKELEDLPAFESELSRAERRLAELDNPKARIKLFEAETAKEFETREAITKIESNLERLDGDKQILLEQLESYKDLDEQWRQSSAERDRTTEAHRIFLTNEAAANSLSQRKTAQTESAEYLSALQKNSAKVAEELAKITAGYDRDLHLSEKAALLEAEKRKAETGATLGVVKRRESELAADLVRLTETRKAMQGEYIEKERLEKVAEATAFIRETLKEAAPRVARNYVYHISAEANQMYREITGNPERTLKWVEDYGIVLEEGGYERPFVSLSGGEQMAAALSVRLALLKQLSDIRIAFFDEPTTNMDAERRENLAMQIGQIKFFDQLFVISHDDTFEGYMDNEIAINK